MAGPSSFECRASRYFLPPALTSLASRLFCRAAAFGWISRFRPARSMQLHGLVVGGLGGRPPAAVRTFLMAERSWLRWVRLSVAWVLA